MQDSNFNKTPSVRYDAGRSVCWSGWQAVSSRLETAVAERAGQRVVLVVDCYQGVFEDELIEVLSKQLRSVLIVRSEEAFKPQASIREMVRPDLTDDPVFGKMTRLTLEDYFDAKTRSETEDRIQAQTEGLILVVGPGAALLSEPDLLIYADLARWEIQQRFRAGAVGNLGVRNAEDSASWKYKWSYFIDWRVLDAHKQNLRDRCDFVLDTNDATLPKLVDGVAYRDALRQVTTQPFMMKPFFDPGPWGGQWMKDVCGLDQATPNYAWCFNCVPEENSLLIDFGGCVVEAPALNLVLRHPDALLGANIVARFGAEFPIRFDFLDTVGGGNLSLQVHPTTDYIREQFGLSYTQDESYYFMDAKPGARVHLGLREGVDKKSLRAELERAQAGETEFDADRFVGSYAVKKHDHVSIPAGTLHCSGKNTMVLEISATPYIFTFKLWDWGRMGLDGKPRPIHIEHGMNVIATKRTESWVRRELLDSVVPVAEGPGWREERTGLHELEFIETRRHWFSKPVPHHTRGTVNVLNLVEGDEVTVESPDGGFAPLVVHYAETFIVPAQVGEYSIRPSGPSEGERCATIKAYVRDATAGQHGSLPITASSRRYRGNTR
jgi:mannose-6-phosphate isomerase class I